MLLTEAIEALCIATRADGRSARTVESYHQKLAALLTFLGDVPVEMITVDDLRHYIADLMDRRILYAVHPSRKQVKGALSPFTVASNVRACRRLFNWLEEEGRIETSPMRRIRTPQPRRREPKGISRQNLLALLKSTGAGSVADLRDRAIILFLADTGCRVGGLCGLLVGDVDLDSRLAVLVEKGGKTRRAPFTRTTARALQEWLAVRPQDKGPALFVGLGNRAKDTVTPTGMARMLTRRAKQAGITGPVNPHSFRHAFARDFLLDGGDLGTLADLLGHTSVLVTKDFYGIFTIQELQEKHARHSPIAQIFQDRDEQKDRTS